MLSHINLVALHYISQKDWLIVTGFLVKKHGNRLLILQVTNGVHEKSGYNKFNQSCKNIDYMGDVETMLDH